MSLATGPNIRQRVARADIAAKTNHDMHDNVALGHPFGATGARIVSQTAKELSTKPARSCAIVSIAPMAARAPPFC